MFNVLCKDDWSKQIKRYRLQNILRRCNQKLLDVLYYWSVVCLLTLVNNVFNNFVNTSSFN